MRRHTPCFEEHTKQFLVLKWPHSMSTSTAYKLTLKMKFQLTLHNLANDIIFSRTLFSTIPSWVRYFQWLTDQTWISYITIHQATFAGITHRPHVLEESILVVLPFTVQFTFIWKFDAAQLQSDFKAIAAQVVEVLHACTMENHSWQVSKSSEVHNADTLGYKAILWLADFTCFNSF